MKRVKQNQKSYAKIITWQYATLLTQTMHVLQYQPQPSKMNKMQNAFMYPNTAWHHLKARKQTDLTLFSGGRTLCLNLHCERLVHRRAQGRLQCYGHPARQRERQKPFHKTHTQLSQCSREFLSISCLITLSCCQLTFQRTTYKYLIFFLRKKPSFLWQSF